MSDRPSSPKATGGAGTIFEYQLAAIMFSRLLRGAHVPIGIQLPLDRVGLQQQVTGHDLDDIVAYSSPAPNGPRIQMQVKQKINIRGKDPDFVKVMAAALRAIRGHQNSIADGTLRLGLVAGEPAGEVKELREVAEMARATPDHLALRALLEENVTSSKIRGRHGHIVTAVAAAASTHDLDEAAALAHQVLSALHVWQVDLGPDGRDSRAEIDQLAAAIPEGLRATDVFAHLCQLAQEYGPRAGQIDANSLQRALRSRFGIQFDLNDEPVAGSASGNAEKTSSISITNNGSGPTWVAESQSFQNIDFRSL
ncbi:hypothetical protein [Microtetraspora niveoalba]|uniref:hypothetical protein n=1 Tax=Microtetraspora niveoalba TaxID=46175 RepID=UPI000AC03F1D|nr:hypothetical protein [Microtetraspora niveoalba]